MVLGNTALLPELRDQELGEQAFDVRAPELTVIVGTTTWQRVAKRIVDVVGGLVLLVVMLPVFAVVAIAVRLSSSGPVLFRHARVGRGGKTIRVTKFRTMVSGASEVLDEDPELKQRYVANGFKLAPDDDPRITKVGRFLRRSSLDELPQLWDVLVGRMSLVGPRPVLHQELDNYEHYVGAYLAVKPGITGLWQVTGRSDIRFPERGRLDFVYAARWTLWLDVRLLARTLPAVMRRRGAY